MNNCGYYSCFKRVPTCKHPSYGELKTKLLKDGYSSARVCDMCKRENHGIYPDKVPTANYNGKVEVVDKHGNVLN